MEANKKKKSKKFWILIAIFVLLVLYCIGTSGDEDIVKIEGEITTTIEKDIPKEYQSALKKADIYANEMHMPKAELYNQLVSEYGEKFSPEAAQYAVNNVKTDWKENALAAAELYQNELNMSPSAIYDQLISEYGNKFTEEEAQYAINNLSK